MERGYIEFAAYEDFAPWSFEQNGKPVGIDVDLAHLIAADLGVEAKIRLVAAGKRWMRICGIGCGKAQLLVDALPMS